MQYITDVREAKEIDRMTIQEIGIPSMVLMEKAALAVAGCVKSNAAPESHVLAVCGMGNNGGDGVAAARMLWEDGYPVTVSLIGKNNWILQESLEFIYAPDFLPANMMLYWMHFLELDFPER